MCIRDSPCRPVVVAGELITPEAAEALSQAPHTFGLRGGEIAVVRTGRFIRQ